MAKHEEKHYRKRLQSSYITTVVSVSLVLFMLGLLGLIILHAKKLSDYVKENIGFSIIARCVLVGMKKAVSEMKEAIR